ncbi:MAG TPA: CBS domain-containing protein [Gemmatimonadaceae bacterium]|nr:CBS domain-containing protein [Gemmatimonadaceae bacterium]
MLRVREIMTQDVVTVSPEATLRDAMALLTARHVSGAPVVAGGRVVGVLSGTDLLSFASSTPPAPRERDEELEPDDMDEAQAWDEDEDSPSAYFSDMWEDAGADVTERFRAADAPEWDVLEEHTVSEVMTRAVCSIEPDADVPHAADYMRRAGIHRLLVMEGGRLVGIISSMDVARAVADGRLTVRTYVFGPPSHQRERGA